ncbi:uncharacterized protein LOC144722339 isoform X1 [Lampetra planeri]
MSNANAFFWLMPLLLLATRSAFAEGNSSGIVDSACDGSFIETFVNASFVNGRSWNVSVEDRSQGLHLLTPRFATQCGYTFHTSYTGTLILRATLTSCHVYQQGSDQVLKMVWIFYPKNQLENVSIIPYTTRCRTNYVWAQREILCAENFREVSISRSSPNIPDVEVQQDDFDINMIMNTAQVWKIFFRLNNGSRFEVDIQQAFQMGYAVNSSDSRVVFRSPYFTNESSSMMIEGTLVDVIRPFVYYADRWSAFLLDMTTACPVREPECTEQAIVWTLPRILQPLVLHLAEVEYKETSVWVDFKKVDSTTMGQRGYALMQTNATTSLSVPWGAEGGFNKSCWVNWHFGMEYIIDLQIQHLWTDDVWDLTRIMISTKGSCPCREIRLQDDVCTDSGFAITMGLFLNGVSIVNLTIGAETFTVCDQDAGGLLLLQSVQAPCRSAEALDYQLHQQLVPWSPDAFYLVLEIPYSAKVVEKQYLVDTTTHVYTLAVKLVLLDTEAQYYITTVQQSCTINDVVLPVAYGMCTTSSLILVVQPGSLDSSTLLFVGDTWLSSDAMEQMGYTFSRNATHYSISMPPDAKGLTIEEVTVSFVKYKFQLRLVDPTTHETNFQLSVSCQFPTTDVIACFPNGTVAVAAPKGHTKPEVDLWRLALRERSCGPVYVNTTKAYFVFTVSSCGTSRTIEGAFLVYENEISLQKELLPEESPVITRDPEYRLKVICRYRINDTVMISSVVQARRGPTADEQVVPVPIVMKISRAGGPLMLQLDIRLFKDADYTSYYLDEEYPVVSYLQEPLYFEVRLLGLEDQSIEMFLENCWATNLPAADSQPRWDLVINSCENANDNYVTIFHPVPINSSVPFPQNVKRFEVKTFVFEMDIEADFQGQLFFHCSVVVCDAVNFDDVCQMDCIPNRRRVARSGPSRGVAYGRVSSGAVSIFPPLGEPDMRSDERRQAKAMEARTATGRCMLLLCSFLAIAALASAAVCVARLARVRHRSVSFSW